MIRKHARRYPWKQWFEQAPITLKQGEDYNGRTDTFVVGCRVAAKKLGYKIKVKIRRDAKGCTIHVLEEDEDE